MPFPHANDAEAVQKVISGFFMKAVSRWLMVFGAIGSLWVGVRMMA